MEARDAIYIVLFVITILSIGINIGVTVQKLAEMATWRKQWEKKWEALEASIAGLRADLGTEINSHGRVLAAMEERCRDHSKMMERLERDLLAVEKRVQ